MTRRSLLVLLLGAGLLSSQPLPEHGKRYARLVVRNAIVVEGNGTPASGPRDILIENNRITRVVTSGYGNLPKPDAEIDAKGKYVLPGFINMHGHSHDERAGAPLPIEYVFKLWLACGITTVRDVGSEFTKSRASRQASAEGSVIAPRLFLYPFFGRPATPELARERVRQLKQQGADGIKIVGIHRDTMDAMMEEARALNLPVAHHVGVEETNAWDNIRNRTTTIEHWYGIPDAALPLGQQNFPPEFNYADEVHRFRYAGRLWREADPQRLRKVLEEMVKANVAWDPTLNIYEASRDLQRAENKPEFQEYLHPSLDRFFRPSRTNHGSYFFGWTTADEVYWKENYRIWMNALLDFAKLGGTVTTGEDAGYIYQVYGFGYLRELELQQEAGFHPLTVVKHATFNGAKMLGQERTLGRVRENWTADLIIVNGNPLENFKILSPLGTADWDASGNPKRSGGIEYTVKDGFVYHVPKLAGEIREIVRKAKGRAPTPTAP
ncbi:MAG: amidohydrolase family protein [Bryobacterales bacterium]|nr:amidohydrolase family protein [Bryobacterales bacterium]